MIDNYLDEVFENDVKSLFELLNSVMMKIDYLTIGRAYSISI